MQKSESEEKLWIYFCGNNKLVQLFLNIANALVKHMHHRGGKKGTMLAQLAPVPRIHALCCEQHAHGKDSDAVELSESRAYAHALGASYLHSPWYVCFK